MVFVPPDPILGVILVISGTAVVDTIPFFCRSLSSCAAIDISNNFIGNPFSAFAIAGIISSIERELDLNL
ncbi:hypothetical protein DLD82_10930 [Methanospirillum stamsii]|uniref:Uncharacterized protein n=1 Tax=Methanospirillum stamsii TaxID=1277351 RepID=A0A2V2N6A9_9EURY|nr:hypothetical protein DLD82_10930 [Methanospirillum stamsii]